MARDKYTIIRHLDAHPYRCGEGYTINGVTDRENAIKQAREHFERQRQIAERFLSAPDNKIDVRIVSGMFRQNLIAILPPDPAS